MNPEFDMPFVVRNGEITYTVGGPYAPEVYHSDVPNVDIEIHGNWEALTGMTGQMGYNGAVLHASEQFEGPVENRVREDDGTYVIVAVEVFPTEDDPDPFPAGWAVLRYMEDN